MPSRPHEDQHPLVYRPANGGTEDLSRQAEHCTIEEPGYTTLLIKDSQLAAEGYDD